VINVLGELAFGRPTPDTAEVILRDRTTAALRALIDDQHLTRDAFSDAAEILALVADEQRELHDRNLRNAIESFSPDSSANSPPEDTDDVLSQRALHAAQDLSPGAVVMLRAGGLAPRRAELGWRCADTQATLFVDQLGHALASLDEMHLARCIETQVVEPSEVARMPVVDRAMCGVLEGIHERLEHKATSDPATGLATSKRLERAVSRALEHATSSGSHHHLVYIGIDTFEEIAEQVSEKATDKLAREYAKVLERQVGEHGLVARVSDPCFVLFMPDSRQTDIERMVERHKKSVEVAKLAYKGVDLPLKVSIGAVALGNNLSDAATAIDAAERAYQASTELPGNSIYFEQSLVGVNVGVNGASGSSAQKSKVEADYRSIQDYIDNAELGLRCQRIEAIEHADGSSAGLPYYEVLLGVRHVDGSMRPPGDVVLAAERNGEVQVLDRWVLNAVFSWMGEHPQWLESVNGLSINLSGATMGEPGLAAEVHSLIDFYAIDAGKIMFEVTESAAIGHLAVAKEFIDSLRERGCRFALDDFGAGHASFSYLKLLPIDTVKIDGLFVRDIVTNPTDQAMVRSINEIAKLLGKKTVAEFVENDDSLGILRGLGVDYAQGYGIEQPMTLDAVCDRKATGLDGDHDAEWEPLSA
jgi:diguanylate cyclase (GGDEF)-like protein